MDRQERNRYYDRNDDDRYYEPYEGYRNDEHYHSARNVTDQFERDYQRERGHGGNDYRVRHTYHEGNMGDAYEQFRREPGGFRDYSDERRDNWRQNRNYSGGFNRDRDRYDSFWDAPGEDQDRYPTNRYRDQDYGSQERRGGRRAGYLISEYDDTFGEYNTVRNSMSRGSDRQDIDPGSGGDDRRSRFGGSYYGGDRNRLTGNDRNSSDRRRYNTDRYY